MKRGFAILVGSLTLVALVAFAAGVRAGGENGEASCFTDTEGHWAEVAICWVKAQGISLGFGDGSYRPENNLTRAEMAVFLRKANRVPTSTGEILVSSGFSNWRTFYSSDPISYSNFANGSYLRSSSVGTYTLVNQPELPVALYGRRLSLVGVEICYQTATGNYLSEVRVRTYTHISSLASSNLRFSDATDRSDTACRYYTLSSPVELDTETGAEVFLDVTWTTINTDFGFGRTTYVLQATENPATAPSLVGGAAGGPTASEIVVLTEDSGPDLSPEARK